MNALLKGFLAKGVRTLGNNLPISISKIKSKLINNNMPKEIGDTIPITEVRLSRNIVVKINPSKNMNNITPNVIRSPNKAIVFLSGSFPDN